MCDCLEGFAFLRSIHFLFFCNILARISVKMSEDEREIDVESEDEYGGGDK